MQHLIATRAQKPVSVIAWVAITHNGRTSFALVPEGVKINQQIYRELVLESCLKLWTHKHFKAETLQQNSALTHKAKETRN
ncbi:hypothetical protein ANTQUA_LOCUS10616 [Anthophora quadrimaculata]